MIVAYFQALTRRNWGAPYHFIIAYLGVNAMQFFGVRLLIAFSIGLAAGLLYEAWQYWQARRSGYARLIARDCREDIVADLIGLLLSIWL